MKKPAPHTSRGVALVIILSFIVLLTVLIVAFFSKAIASRGLSDSSLSQSKTETLARSALEVIVGDLKQEIANGSTPSTTNNFTIYTPSVAANIIPKLNISNTMATAIPNLIRKSVQNDGIAAPGVACRASAVNSNTDASTNGRSISLARWNKHYLIPLQAGATDTTPVAEFTAPDWVYVNGQGPQVITAPSKAVTGRYAYAIYDEGGMLDVNAAGYPNGVASAEIGKKGFLGLADLTQLPGGITQAQIDKLVGWRNYATVKPSGFFPNLTTDASSATSFLNFLKTNATGFLKTSTETWNGTSGAGQPRTDQSIISRQQLLALQTAIGFTASTLQYLGTFSREKNAPSWSPQTPSGSSIDYDAQKETSSAFNRNLANMRVATAFTRADGSPANVGDVLLKKRFPLSRLGLITLTATETGSGDIYKFFGLKRATATANWTYNHGAPLNSTGGQAIATLDQVSQMTPAREPDFFELLQATILNGSLGKTGGNTLAQSDAPDSNTFYQLIRIAANIIDQYDGDSIPTTISFDSQDFYGIENLPYINQIFILIAKNTTKTPKPIDNFQLYPYAAFQLWNPHDPTLSGPSTASPQAIRIRPLAGGAMYVRGGQDPAPPSTNGKLVFDGATSISIPATDFPNYAQPQIPKTDLVGPIFDVSAFSIRAIAQPLYDQSFAWLWLEIPSSTVFTLEYQDASGWHPYNTFAGLVTLPAFTGLLNSVVPPSTNTSIPYPMLYSFSADQACKAPVTPPAKAITSKETWYNSIMKSDPRTSRFGASFSAQIKPAGQPSPPAGYILDGKQNSAPRPTTAPTMNGGNGYWTANGRPNWCSATVYYPGLLAQNTTSGQQYADRDGVTRPSDGAVNLSGLVNPLYDPAQSPSNEDKASRPIVLNRPFRSVGELAYVFRDQPWKSLDFSSASSADAGLLDVFSVDESDMTADRVNLNTRQKSVLAAILSGAFKTDASTAVANPTEIADGMATWHAANTFINRGDIAKAISSLTISNTSENKVKTQREATARALSENTKTRTWNVMIDVVAQSGRLTPNASAASNPLAQFIVEGEKRYWLHIAIDRFTGEVIDQQLEAVYE